MPRRTPRVDMESADRYSFLLSEFSEFKSAQSHLVSDIQATFKLSQSQIISDIASIKQLQSTTVLDIAEIKNNIMGIKAVLFEKRNGKDSICQTIDIHAIKIKGLEEERKQKSAKEWEIHKALPIALIVSAVNGIMAFIFYLIFYKP